ncbi:SDR family oxidoreductase [Microbispora sp. H10885]|uniref:SDR family oxidoreductase n=1 Tax=Microbispora sp. H10885 TaxID=2729110 RepID=UPI00160030B5|nr:NmrA family NAD(P)-binding protein [Microbispora sp. H10885]
MTKMIVAVHGATGTQGSPVVWRLRALGHQVRPLNSASADLADAASLAAAYKGADAVVVQLPQVFGEIALRHAASVLAALCEAGVPRVVFNPGMPLPPAPVGVPFVDARVLLARDLPVRVVASVIGPAGPYLENLAQPWSARRVREHGELVYPLPAEAPVPWSALDDLADAVGAALTGAEPPARLVVTGPEEVTGDRIAAAVASAAGRPVRYLRVEPADYARLITPVVGREAAEGIAGFYAPAAAATPPPIPEGRLHRGTTTVERWAARQAWR